jgi:hypothetical protein
MDSFERVRRELLRLAGAKRHSICVNTRRISALYNIPEKSVRRELTNLAGQNIIRVSAWDGRQVRSIDAWPSVEEFVDSQLGDGHVHVDLCEKE